MIDRFTAIVTKLMDEQPTVFDQVELGRKIEQAYVDKRLGEVLKVLQAAKESA